MKLNSSILILFFIFQNYCILGQNSVSNGSFEAFSTCPNSFGQINLVDNWDVVANTGNASPDFFNTCSFTPYMDVPTNNFGSQLAFDGVSYVGIATYSISNTNLREYLQTQLNSPLVAGQNYLISFMVSRGDGSGKATNNLGAVLSALPLQGNGTNSFIPVTPQINETNVLADKIEWMEVSGSYIASGGEEFLSIGNFYDDVNTIIIETGGVSLAYYYIDNVSIIPINLGISHLDSVNIDVYPNPFTTEIKFEHPVCDIENIKICSMLGETVSLPKNNNLIDLRFLSAGIYYLIITGKDGKKFTKKIMKL